MSVKQTQREQILQTAHMLVAAKGASGTGVDEICKACGVTKGSFYHHFPSKDALLLALVDAYFNDLTNALTNGPWTDENSPAQRFLAFLDHLTATATGPLLLRGCLLGVLSIDQAHSNQRIQTEIAQRFDTLIETIATLVPSELASPQGTGSRPRDTASQTLCVLQGALLLGKAYADEHRVTNELTAFRRMCAVIIAAARADPKT